MMRASIDGNRWLEIVVLMLFFGIVAGVVFVGFVRPRLREAGVRVQQSSDVSALIRAISQLRGEAGGSLGSLRVEIPDTPKLIGSGAGEVNLCALLVPEFLVAMPVGGGAAGVGVGPAHYRSCADYETGYEIFQRGGEVVVR